MKLLLCGFYGANNFGDELLLNLFISALPSHAKVYVLSQSHALNKEDHRIEKVVQKSAPFDIIKSFNKVDCLILGGGSLLQDETSIFSLVYYLIIILIGRIKNLPVYLWGQGIGPINHKILLYLTLSILRNVQLIGVRDHQSFDLVKKLNVQTYIAPDPVWQLDIGKWIGGGPIVICLRESSQMDQAKWRKLISSLDLFLDKLDLDVVWLAFKPNDDYGLYYKMHNLGLISPQLEARSIHKCATSVEEVSSYFRYATMAITMRFHSLLLSQLNGCPTLGLSYDQKVSNLAATCCCNFIELDKMPTESQIVHMMEKQLEYQPQQDIIQRFHRESFIHSIYLNRFLAKIN